MLNGARLGFRHAPAAPTKPQLSRKVLGPLLGLLTLLGPAVLATWAGLYISGVLEDVGGPWLDRLTALGERTPIADVLTGPYGVLTMLPLLLIWALPLVVLHAAGTAVTKASGLLDRASAAVEPLFRPFRLTGRDVSRVVMGYGCNVPAVAQGRSCLSCTRESCSAAIAFGSACSYQLGAVLGVLSAARQGQLVLPYLVLLLAGALVCARWTAGRRQAPGRMFVAPTRVRRPSLAEVWRELHGPVLQMVTRVVPIFLAITVLTSLLDAVGALDVLAAGLGPVLGVLGLPAAVAPAVAAAAVRKDGILLLAAPTVLTTLSPATLLAALVLASTLLPCAVTVLTLVREHGVGVAVRMLARAATVSLFLTAAIALPN